MPLEYYYSGDPSVAPFVELYSLEHILYLLFCFAAVYLLIRFRKGIREKRDTVSKIFLGILLFQQIFLLYGWYYLFHEDFLAEGLPLQMCRVSSLLTIFFLITKNTKFMDVVFYFSIYALISLFYPQEVYHFCHVNGLSYMINHLITVLMPIFGAIAYGWRPTWKSFFRACGAFTVYLPVAIIVNQFTNGNYFYLERRPFFHDMPAWLFDGLAYVVTIAGFALATFAVYWITGLVQKKR